MHMVAWWFKQMGARFCCYGLWDWCAERNKILCSFF